MPRLFVASGIFHPDPGGPATYLKQLLPALQEQGWEIRVLSYGEPQDNPSAYPYPVQRIPRIATPWRQMRYAAAALHELRKTDLIFEQSIDLPIFGSRVPRVLRVGGDSLWERAVRNQWLPEDMNMPQFQSFQGKFWLRTLRTLRKRKLQRYSACIVPSQTQAELVHGWGTPRQRTHIIENAIEIQPEILSMIPLNVQEQLKLPEGIILLYVGRIQPFKGLESCLNAIAHLPDLHLIIAGDGPMLKPLQQRAAQWGISDRVHFLGRLDAHGLAMYYRAADYVLLYSAYEGLSHVLLEALSYGTPVLASDIPGNRELVKHGENGLLIPHETDEARASAAIQKAIQLAISDEYRQILRQATLQAPERFHFSRQVEQTDALLRSALA